MKIHARAPSRPPPGRRGAGMAAVLALAAASAGCASTLRIAVFNVKWLTESAHETRMAPWRTEDELAAHRTRLASVLDAMRPDVLCVIEATSRRALEKLADQPELRRHGYRVLHVESGDTGTGQDVAFLVLPSVRLDTVDGREIRRFADTLPGRPPRAAGDPAARQRLTKHAVICLPLSAGPVCVMGLHLLAHPDDPARTARRETQARIAAHLIREEIVSRGYAPVVLGDFNDFDPDADPGARASGGRRVLRIVKDYDPARPGPELFNAAERIPAQARYSAYRDRNGNGRRDGDEPVSLIDHVLLHHTLAGRLAKAEILHEAHDGSVSDHWPVVVELE